MGVSICRSEKIWNCQKDFWRMRFQVRCLTRQMRLRRASGWKLWR